MRLLILSDIHGHTERVQALSNAIKDNSPDAVVISGDITHFGSLATVSAVLKEFVKLGTILFVPGNCDPPALALEPMVEGATNLHGRCTGVSGVDFIGVGGSIPTPFRTLFELTEDEIGRMLDAAQKDCHEVRSKVLISHNPPYGTAVDRVFLGHHVGSRAVREFIEKTGPALVVCGHIHESRAVESFGATVIVNPGPFHRSFYALAEVGEKVLVNLEIIE